MPGGVYCFISSKSICSAATPVSLLICGCQSGVSSVPPRRPEAGQEELHELGGDAGKPEPVLVAGRQLAEHGVVVGPGRRELVDEVGPVEDPRGADANRQPVAHPFLPAGNPFAVGVDRLEEALHVVAALSDEVVDRQQRGVDRVLELDVVAEEVVLRGAGREIRLQLRHRLLPGLEVPLDLGPGRLLELLGELLDRRVPGGAGQTEAAERDPRRYDAGLRQDGARAETEPAAERRGASPGAEQLGDVPPRESTRSEHRAFLSVRAGQPSNMPQGATRRIVASCAVTVMPRLPPRCRLTGCRNERERAIEREQWPLDPDERQRLQTVAAHARAVKQDDRTGDVRVPGAELDVRLDDHDPGVVRLEPDGAVHRRVDRHHRVANDQERDLPRRMTAQSPMSISTPVYPSPPKRKRAGPAKVTVPWTATGSL